MDCHIFHDTTVHVQATSLLFRWDQGDGFHVRIQHLGDDVLMCRETAQLVFTRCHDSCFNILSLRASGWGPPKFERAPQIKSLKLVCVVVENKKISRDVKGLFFLGVISSRWIKSSPRSAIVPLQLVGELLRKRGVVSWVVSWAYWAIWAKVL